MPPGRAPQPTVGTGLGGTFSPQGFVPNKPKVVAPPDQAPYKSGRSPAQQVTKAAAASGAIQVTHPKTTKQNSATKQLQRMLNEHGAHLNEDGVWGPNTEAAYQAYMHSAGSLREQTKNIDASTSPLYVAPPTPQSMHAEVQAQKAAERSAALARMRAYHPQLKAGPTQSDSETRYAHEMQLNVLMSKAADLARTDPGGPQWKASIQAVRDYTLRMGLDKAPFQPSTTLTSVLGSTAEPGQQEALSKFYAQNHPVGQEILSGIAGSLPGVGLVSRVAKGQHISAGNVVGEVINDALWLTPGQYAEGVTKLLAATTGKIADHAMIGEAATLAASRPLTGAVKDQIAHAIYSTPNIDAQQAQAALHLFDTAAYAEAARQGVDPNIMLKRIWSGARYSADHPELRGDISGVHAQLDNAEKVAQDAKTPDGGATLHGDLTPHEGGGYAVAMPGHEEQIPAGEFTGQHLTDYRNAKQSSMSADARIGVWHNPEDGKVYLDLSKVLDSKEAALAAGRAGGQHAIFDLHNFESIPTGITQAEHDAHVAKVIGNEPLVKDIAKSQDVTPVKGAVVRGEDLRHDLLLTPKSDVSTVVHELLHAMRPYLGALPANEEAVARAFEAWVQEGRAPLPQLQPAFDTLAKGMREVYGDAPAGALSDDLRSTFDNFFQRQGYMLPSEKTLEISPRDRYIPIFIDGENKVIVGEPGLDHAAIDPKGNSYATHGYAVVFDGKIERVNFSETNMSEGVAKLDSDPQIQAMVKQAVEAKYGVKSAAEPGTFAQAEHATNDEGSGAAHDLAAQHGIEIGKVTGTGKDGRVTVKDVQSYVFEQMTPEEQLRSLFKGLRVQRGKQQAGYSVERSERSGKVAGIFGNENLSAEEKMIASGEAMQGELPKITIGGHAREMNQGALEHLMQTVFYHPNLQPFQKRRVAEALRALVTEGRTPTKSELALMQHVWGRDTVGSLQEIASNWKKYGNLMLSTMNIPRSIMSSMDVSFGLRQALVAAFYDPQTWYKAWKAQFAYLSKYTGGGEEAYQALMRDIHASPNFPLYQEMGLSITDMEAELGLREEQYQSNLAEKATIKGHGPGNLIRGSGRAYTGMAVKLRTELADKMLVQAAATGRDITDAQLLKEMGHFINGITGRGDLPGKVLQESAPLLNSLFFSPRLLASRIQMLNPKNYIMGDKFVRRQYLRAGLRTFGTLATILGAIKMFVPGAVVGTDWRSSDFGKIKIGDTRVDLGGGFNQLFHLMGMIYAGQKVSSANGRVTSLTSNKFGQATRADAFVNFLSGKLAPTPAMVNDWAKNKDPQHPGQPFNWKDEAASHFQPLIAQDAWNLYNDPVHGLNGLEAAAAGYGLEATGVGLQTYGPPVPGKNSIKQYEEWASATGVKIPAEVKQQMLHSAYLKSITTAHPKDAEGAMKEMIAYYTKTTGKHDLDRYLSVTNEGMQKRVMTAIRARMAGSASRYESAIKYRAKAKGLTK